ncbi:MAG: choice-of-anchor Q domain-containing protein [Anaerolineae bacterium]
MPARRPAAATAATAASAAAAVRLGRQRSRRQRWIRRRGGLGRGRRRHGGSPGFNGGDACNNPSSVGGAGSGMGGAIFNDGGTVIIRNSTLANNRTEPGADGPGLPPIFPRPGGNGAVVSRNGTLRIIHSTFSDNAACSGCMNDVWVIGDGATATFELRNSILANGNGGTRNCLATTTNGGGVSQSNSGNLIEIAGGSGGSNTACAGVATSADPGLGPLQENAPGNTPTMAIGPTSPALDAADAAQGLATDQRGVTRPQGVGFDIGAFEVQVVDVRLTKSCYARPIAGSPTQDPDVVIAGQQWICDIAIVNPSGTALGDVTVTDNVPAGATFVAHTAAETQVSGTVPACTPLPSKGPSTVTCVGIDLGANSTTTFQLAFVIDPAFVATSTNGELPISNTACVVVTNFIDPNLANNCDTETDLVKELANLKVTKISEPHDHVRAGQVFTYTIYVDNTGPSVARKVVVTDTLLSSSNVSIQSCAFSVSQGGGAITQFSCTTGNLVSTQFGTDIGTFATNRLDPLSPTSQGRLRASFRLVAKGQIDLTNTVRTTSSTPDPDMSDNFAQDTISVTAVADLQAFAVFGAEVQTNGLPGKIFDSNVVTAMPDPACCNFGGTTVTAGRRIQWDGTILNAGPSVAENVQINVYLPFGTSLIENTLNGLPNAGQVQGRCRTEPAGALRNKVICEYGPMFPGKQASVRFLVLVDPNLPVGTQLSFDMLGFSDATEEAGPAVQQTTTFKVAAAPDKAAQGIIEQPGTFDPNLSNNIAGIQFDTNAFADLSITKAAVGDVVSGYNSTLGQFTKTQVANQVTAGELLEYLLTVTHKGPSLARGVHIRDDLPGPAGPIAQVQYVSATDMDGQRLTCVISGVNRDIVDCDLGDLAPGAVRRVRILVRVDASVATGTVLANSAVVSSNTSEPFASDNTATNNTTVAAAADVYITKVDVPAEARLDKPFEPDLAVAGREHRYLITIGNNGPSAAVGVGVTDLLDLKAPGLLGERFLRCEPFDLDDAVTCSFAAVNTVTLTHLQVGNENVVPTAGTGTLTPGKAYSFYLITTVDEGYVLDGVDLLATDTASISTTTTDFRAQNNQDRHDTLIIAEADLGLLKVDDAAGFLRCDPVQRGGTITYDITVTNNGPSDAADVFVVDQLPVNYVVADPAQVTVTVSRGQVVEVRDDGQITIRVGNDVNNSGVAQLGRLNAPGSPGAAPVTIRIVATVRSDAACGGSAENVARVETRRNDAVWPIAPQPFPGIDGGPRTPTLDPSPANNSDNELTKIECPGVQVVKTVSFDGTCPGVNISAGVFNRTGQPVTFCFEVTNTGTTYLDNIFLSDVLDTRTLEPTVIFTDTITAGADPKLPVKPGETVLRQVTIPQLECECGIATDTATVTANPVNSGRTDLPCLTDVTDTDRADIDVPCAGVDWRLQLPILGGTTCPTLIQVQNLGRTDTKVILVAWGDESFCPPQAAGPLKVECGGLLRPGSAWTFTASQLPASARSAVLYSVNATDLVTNVDGNQSRFDLEVCDALMTHVVGNWKQWSVFDLAYRRQLTYRSPFDASGLHQFALDFKAHQGEPIAATVNRACPDAADPNVTSNAAYTGISSDQEGARDPVSGARMFYAPLVFVNKGGLSSKICIQNSGDECTSLELWFKAQDACLRNTLADVLTLSPGESTCFDPSTVVGPDWLGSAYIRSTQPLGIVVDTKGPNHFTAYNGLPADVFALGFSAGNQVSYLPLTYSEYQGWDTAIQVQNLDPTVSAKVKVYFLDRSGDIVTTLVDWVCARGSQTFFLPVIANLPGQWAGSARVESQEWVTPGGPNVLAPRVMAVAMLERWSDPARTSRREAIAYNGQGECLLYDWQLGSGTGGTASGAAVLALPLVAKANRGINSEIAITNLVPKPGFTDFVVFFYDQNGLIEQVCQKFSEKEVDYISLDGYGFLDRGYLGSAVISAVFWEHDVFDDHGVFLRNVVGMGAVAIERMGTAGAAGADVPGDESKGYEAFPVFATYKPNDPLRCPGVPGGFGGR